MRSEPWKKTPLGPFLLKLARDIVLSGCYPNKHLECAIRATKSVERSSGPGLRSSMSLLVFAVISGSLRRFDEAIWSLEQSTEVSDHAPVKLFGFMLIGDTYLVMEQVGQSILCYESGLKIQIEAVCSSDTSWTGLQIR